MGMTYGAMETLGAAIGILTPPIAGVLYERDPMMIYPLAIGLMAISIMVSSLFLPRKVSHAEPQALRDSLSAPTAE